MRCGSAPDAGADGAPGGIHQVVGDHGPEACCVGSHRPEATTPEISRVHLFCFGGFLKTCRWLQAIAEGRFLLMTAKASRFRVVPCASTTLR